MRYSLYSLIIFVVFIGVLYYIVTILSPWDEQAVNQAVDRFGLLTGSEFQEFVIEGIENGSVFYLLNIKNVIAIGVVLLVVIVSGFSALHLFIDKLFFRKFYENPSVFSSIRRGTILGLLVESLVLLRLNGSFETYIVAGCIVLTALIEVLFLTILDRRKNTEKLQGKIVPVTNKDLPKT
ncbi:hypothetical protein JW796_01715 [Candidatus Dojkabacteria bacterium]|nr:hypothetical protein [Candidatus Dojkabacteria bacterium]